MIKSFLARFPEFSDELEDGGKEVITLTLQAAESELNTTLWGNLFEEGVFYLAADKLVRSRVGEQLRDPDEPSAKSVYAIEFERLCRVVSMGARVI
jgi:hypothetical protein